MLATESVTHARDRKCDSTRINMPFCTHQSDLHWFPGHALQPSSIPLSPSKYIPFDFTEKWGTWPLQARGDSIEKGPAAPSNSVVDGLTAGRSSGAGGAIALAAALAGPFYLGVKIASSKSVSVFAPPDMLCRCSRACGGVGVGMPFRWQLEKQRPFSVGKRVARSTSVSLFEPPGMPAR
jgi:hypothetical protein